MRKLSRKKLGLYLEVVRARKNLGLTLNRACEMNGVKPKAFLSWQTKRNRAQKAVKAWKVKDARKPVVALQIPQVAKVVFCKGKGEATLIITQPISRLSETIRKLVA